MELALAPRRPNWLLRGLILGSVVFHLLLALWVSDAVRVKLYSVIKVSMFKGAPPSRALPRPRPRPQKPPPDQAVKPLSVPKLSMPAPPPPRIQAPPSAPAVAGTLAIAPDTGGLPTGALAPPTLPMAAEELSAYREMLRAAVGRSRKYPIGAKRRGLEGRVKVWFLLNRKGSLLKLKLLRSSGHDELDRAALEAVRTAAPFPPPPAGTPGAGLALELTIAFELY